MGPSPQAALFLCYKRNNIPIYTLVILWWMYRNSLVAFSVRQLYGAALFAIARIILSKVRTAQVYCMSTQSKYATCTGKALEVNGYEQLLQLFLQCNTFYTQFLW